MLGADCWRNDTKAHMIENSNDPVKAWFCFLYFMLFLFLQTPFVADKRTKGHPCSFSQNIPLHIETHLSLGLAHAAVLPTGRNPDEEPQRWLVRHKNPACELTIKDIIWPPTEMHVNSFLFSQNLQGTGTNIVPNAFTPSTNARWIITHKQVYLHCTFNVMLRQFKVLYTTNQKAVRQDTYRHMSI